MLPEDCRCCWAEDTSRAGLGQAAGKELGRPGQNPGRGSYGLNKKRKHFITEGGVKKIHKDITGNPSMRAIRSGVDLCPSVYTEGCDRSCSGEGNWLGGARHKIRIQEAP